MVEEAQKYLAKRVLEILVEKGILDNHFKANIQTEETWEQALTEAMAQALDESLLGVESTRKRLEQAKRDCGVSGHLLACALLEILDKLEELKENAKTT